MKKVAITFLAFGIIAITVSLVEGCQKSISQTTSGSTDNTVVIQVPMNVSITTYSNRTDSVTGRVTQVPSTSTMASFSFYSYNLDTDTKTAIPITMPQNVVVYAQTGLSRSGNILFKVFDFTGNKEVWYSYITKTNTLKILPLAAGSNAIGIY